MEIKCSVFIATSLDGFIARPDGSIDWLTGQPESGNGEDYGYKTFMNSVDALVMGRNTYEQVLTFGEWPYPGKKVIVLSSGSPQIPEKLTGSIEVMGGAPETVLAQISQRGVHHCYVDGGNTIQRFLRAGLIHEMIITQIPILIGQGLPLFGPLNHDMRLQHLETKTYPNGFVQSRYRSSID